MGTQVGCGNTHTHTHTRTLKKKRHPGVWLQSYSLLGSNTRPRIGYAAVCRLPKATDTNWGWLRKAMHHSAWWLAGGVGVLS